MRYEPNAKHKEPWQRGRRGSLCPREIEAELAQQLLAGSASEGEKRYAVHDGRAYAAQAHGDDAWHGYPVAWMEVPERLWREGLRDGRLKKRDLHRFWSDAP